SPHLAGLLRLFLGSNNLDKEGAAALAACRHLASLRWLSLVSTGITDEGLSSLAFSPPARLDHLNLRDTGLTADAGQILAGGRHLAGVTWLDLEGNRLGVVGTSEMAP